MEVGRLHANSRIDRVHCIPAGGPDGVILDWRHPLPGRERVAHFLELPDGRYALTIDDAYAAAISVRYFFSNPDCTMLMRPGSDTLINPNASSGVPESHVANSASSVSSTGLRSWLMVMVRLF